MTWNKTRHAKWEAFMVSHHHDSSRQRQLDLLDFTRRLVKATMECPEPSRTQDLLLNEWAGESVRVPADLLAPEERELAEAWRRFEHDSRGGDEMLNDLFSILDRLAPKPEEVTP